MSGDGSSSDRGDSPSPESVLLALARAPVRPLGEVNPGEKSDAPPTLKRPSAALVPGTLVGRYVVLEHVGSGGMGLVYSAWDPELERRVALKLLRASGDALGSAGRRRLQREAKTLAALSHPNVVTVYDVGEHDGEIFIAMELVAGRTLAAWLRDAKRTWRDIVAMFLHAGRGLAAAHAAGIVHRDFKPDNVLVGEDGRVRVSDFGLARAAIAVAPSHPAEGNPGDAPAGGDTLTRGSALVGTPHYMAPEQREGRAVDARADQFAFCLALREALSGARHRRGRAVRIPAPIDPLLRRGQETDAAARHASMADLVARLERALARRGRVILVLGALAFLAGGAVLANALQPSDRPRPCEGAGRKLAGVWDEARKSVVRQALTASNPAIAADTWPRLRRVFDDYAGGFVRAHTAACEATRVRGEQSEVMLDRRIACLEVRRTRLRALTTRLATPPVEVSKALAAAFALPGFAVCSDAQALLAAVAPPLDPAVAARAAELRQEIARARAMEDLGQLKEAKVVAAAAVAGARSLAYEPILAEALHRLGVAHANLRESLDAAATLEAAALAAEASRHDEIVARARVWLVFVVGHQQAQKSARAREVPYADAAVRRWREDVGLRGRLLLFEASMEQELDGRARALELRREALSLWERHFGAGSPKLALPLQGIANDLQAFGRYDEAHAYYQRAIALQERTYGPEHPVVATAVMNLGTTLRRMGRYADAVAAGQRTLAMREKVFGADHLEVATALNNLSNAFGEMTRHREAITAMQRALRIWEAKLPPNHPYLSFGNQNMGNHLKDVGRYEEALVHHRRALALVERRLGAADFNTGKSRLAVAVDLALLGRVDEARATYEQAIAVVAHSRGADHPELAFSHYMFAEALQRQGAQREALRIHERALAMREKTLGPKHHHVGLSLTAIAEIRLDDGDATAALTALERARPIMEAASDAPLDLANFHFHRARALRRMRRRPESDAAVREAERAVAKMPVEGRPLLLRIARWKASPGAR